MVNVELFEFQENAVLKLLDLVTDSNSKQIITMKAPTGAGKTVMLIKFIDDFLSNISNKYAFVWLCPGKGDLEEQSYNCMQSIAPLRNSKKLFDVLQSGFEDESTAFINWELITKSGNTALKEGERKNLFDKIRDAERAGTRFILIIDEEHSHDTKKAADIINAFGADHIIRVSATAKVTNKGEFFEINEEDVIESGLITKAIYINEGIENNSLVEQDYNTLLPLADAKRKEMLRRYSEREISVRPLVLIQFPNGEPAYVEAVEKKLEEMGYSYDNGYVCKWMSGQHKDIPSNLTANDAIPAFLLMKQAISTGWDCPRAKILVKLRENMSEQFTIQTIGRIRRMPERMHYNDEILDYSYVYTFDEEYKAGLIGETDKAYEVRRLFLKEKCKTFTLTKENRDEDYAGLGKREVLKLTYRFLMNKYHLSNNKKENQEKLSGYGYKFGNELFTSILQDKVAITDTVARNGNYITVRSAVNTHSDGIRLLHTIDALKKITSMQSTQMRAVLERLFRQGKKSNNKILSLPTNEFYAFIINNADLLKEEFREIVSSIPTAENQQLFFIDEKELHRTINPKKSSFKILEEEFYRYDTGVKDEVDMLTNAYEKYTSGFCTDRVRSMPEVMFEDYCEENDNVEWVYKNGDSGQNYFSVVYIDGSFRQLLFYPDYIVKLKDGRVFIIETKGGETGNADNNIDIMIANKFNGFKRYAKENNINWGFVRPKSNKLYINNTEFHSDLSNEHWVPLKSIF